MNRVIGLALICAGIYFLGQNVLLTTRIAPFWWQDISAAACVLSLSAGLLMVLFGPSDVQMIGWFVVGVGVVLVFAAGSVVLRPTSLWQFVAGMAALAGGIQFMNRPET